MSLTQVAQLTAFAVMLAAGQILFKRAADSHPPLRQVADLVGLAGNLYVWTALLLYGTATLYWIWLLQRIPLSRAYPFAALSFVLVPALAALTLGEAVGLRYVVGIVLLTAGVCLTAYG